MLRLLLRVRGGNMCGPGASRGGEWRRSSERGVMGSSVDGATTNRWGRVVRLAGRLVCRDERSRSGVDAIGVKCGRLDSVEKNDRVHKPDAVVAHLYGLTEAQLVHVLEAFQDGWNQQHRLDAVLAHGEFWSRRR